MRLVLDTNVLVAAMRSPRGASAALFKAVHDRRITPVVNVPLFIEYEAVLSRPEHLAAGGHTLRAIYEALDEFAALAILTTSQPVRPLLDDPNDDMVVEAAIGGSAEAIVTFEIRTFAKAQTLGLAILTPAQAYARIKP